MSGKFAYSAGQPKARLVKTTFYRSQYSLALRWPLNMVHHNSPNRALRRH
jgi:hypothetical protein